MKHSPLIAGAFLALASGAAGAAPLFADIVVIMDESGSMSGEQAWSGGMITSLDAGLIAAGLTNNRYGLVGFGNAPLATRLGREVPVGGGQFGTAPQFGTATGSLLLNGSFEDGYSGINFANGYSFRPGAARNYILVTDEDRDNGNAALTYASVLTSLQGTNTLLNAVVDASFTCTGGGTGSVLGIGAAGLGYRANGTGGFTTTSGCSASSGAGTTIADYVNLAIASGGAAWNLNLLRAGGVTATSFTAAFIDLKVREISTQPIGPTPVPAPATLGLLGAALFGVGFARRRRAV